MSQKEIDILKRMLAREKSARKQAEQILEKKSEELYKLNQKNKESKEKLEALLKVKNSELKGFFENIVDPYIMMDLFGNVVKLNVASEELLGYKVSDGILNLMKLTFPKDFEYVTKSFEILHTTGRITDFNVDLNTKYKGVRLVKVNASIIYDEHNKPIAAQGILRDITKEKKAEKILLESESRLSTLLLNLDSSVVLEDEHDKIVLTNQKFCDLFEITTSLEDLKEQSYVEVLESSKVIESIATDFINSSKQITAQKEIVLDEEVLLADGRTIRRNYIPIFVENEYKGHLWSFKDVTLRKYYQKSLEAEKQKYVNIIANMNLGLLEVDAQDTILYSNQSFQEMSGYTAHELLGKKRMDIFIDVESRKLLEKENRKRKGGGATSYELKVRNKQQEEKYWLISGAPNYNLNGQVIGSIGIHLDITNLKALENQKEELLKELAASNDNLQEYAHIVSHDLKSPLRSIDALISWIKEDNQEILNEVTLSNFNLIDKTLEKMENLISDVLEYSSIGANNNLEESVSLDLLLKELTKTIYVPQHIEIKIAENLPIVFGDSLKLEQLFQNLLSNAVKFCDKKQGFIEVQCKDIGEYYEFSVTDNGIGIEPQYFEKIFKIFNSLNKRKDSTGIGLSIVRKIVEIHGGEVWLESEIKKGTSFYFTLKKIER